jgi:hypothetical protein
MKFSYTTDIQGMIIRFPDCFIYERVDGTYLKGEFNEIKVININFYNLRDRDKLP